ncbi:MAG: CDP-diacylglycerol--glycerol-3-phosphate 3-phosphatidyltransferase [Candidatus Tokpelaia sp. JSC161]|jgi:cardiolipin synthase|nr:MAG: CDP-diacylglycerol--glycerol-3-phosphate 3-phosphatidyltransferase [Candidatus Tokpelaia sp. JSC161]
MKKHIVSLPNLLTYGRILAVPLFVLCFFLEGHLQSTNLARWSAFAIFLSASITDFFDGYLARVWHQTSDFGRMLDPIADKLLVSACLLLLAADGTIAGWTLWAAITILCREILVSGLREYLAEIKISVPVSRLAKWKTMLQLTALSFLLLGPSGEKIFPYSTLTGLLLLWISAILTLITGWDYCRIGFKHVIK